MTKELQEQAGDTTQPTEDLGSTVPAASGNPPEMLRKSVPLEQALDEAVAYQKNGDFAQAEAIYKAILGTKPNSFNTLHLYGLLQHQQGNSRAAVGLI